MRIKTEEFSDLIGLLYEGLLRQVAWTEFLREFGRRVGSDQLAIAIHDLENRHPAVGFSVGIAAQTLEEWTTRYGSQQPRTVEVMETLKRQRYMISGRSLHDAPQQLQKTEYAKWLIRSGFYHSVLAVFRLGSGAISLSIMRPKSMQPFGERELELVHLLLPHIRRAMQVHARNETARILVDAQEQFLKQLDTGAMAVDENGRVMLMNERAQSALQKQEALYLRSGRLAARLSSESIRLDQLIRSAPVLGGGAIALHGSEHSELWPVIVTPFRSDRVFAQERPSALVAIYDPTEKPKPRSASLQSLFRLTPAECRLAGLLHEGLGIGLAADRMGVTAATARFMLTRVFHKTGAHRQSQLMRLLSNLPGES
jgi:DNA-binding CsgD family transcriptional regulator